MARKKSVGKSGVVAQSVGQNGTEGATRTRNEMWYAIVGLVGPGRNLTTLAVKPTVGKARKLYQDMRIAFSQIATEIKIVRCVVVPNERPADEPEESAQ